MDILAEIERQILRYPEKIAASDETCQLTFRELAETADRAAAALYAKRRTENEIVGYLGGADVACLVANLAIMKAGQCIVILDPHSPVAALQDLAEHSGMAQCVAAPDLEPLAEKVLHY